MKFFWVGKVIKVGDVVERLCVDYVILLYCLIY